MNRCPAKPRPARAWLYAATALTLWATAPGHAQVTRQFPPNALRGDLVVTTPPEVLMNGQPARLSPGARIHNDTNNALVLSASLSGQKWRVHYVCDPQGLVHQVWLLTEQEARQGLPGQRRNPPVCGARP